MTIYIILNQIYYLVYDITISNPQFRYIILMFILFSENSINKNNLPNIFILFYQNWKINYDYIILYFYLAINLYI